MNNTIKSITFQVEELTRPRVHLARTDTPDILKELILSKYGHSSWSIKKAEIDSCNILAQSCMPEKLVSFGYHSFFTGMHQAYADHRPFILSPDMIWLLISQGFALHVNNNAEELREYFTPSTGKVQLIVKNDAIDLNNPDSPWQDVFPEFTKQIGVFTGNELIDALSCNFTTTTPTTKVAAEITIMEAMKHYFEFVVMRIVCGIPEITLEGEPEDWKKIIEKANYLRRYKLDWWIDEIEPLLQQFVNASQGDVDKDFWINIFKFHKQKQYGAPDRIDGWMVKFFPYGKDGKRNNLAEIIGTDNLPDEIVKVDLLHIEEGPGYRKETPLELWAGFIGLEQNMTVFSLKPHIGWLIRKKDENDDALLVRLNKINVPPVTEDGITYFPGHGIALNVKSFPPILFKMEKIYQLHLSYADKIDIPDNIGEIEIMKLELDGDITPEGEARIKALLPNTTICINRWRNMPPDEEPTE
jgi:hypothetical protein